VGGRGGGEWGRGGREREGKMERQREMDWFCSCCRLIRISMDGGLLFLR